MSNHSQYLLIFFIVITYFTTAWGQSVSVSPSGLRNIPFGATEDNPFWQRLKVELKEHPSAGDTIVVRLPAEIAIADTDQDGELADEVNLEESLGIGTGYRMVQSVSSRRIVLKSTYGGMKGTIYVHFPIITPSKVSSTKLAYGQISFSNSGEQPVSAGMLMLSIVQPRDLNVVQLNSVFDRALNDTISNPQGDIFPTSYPHSVVTRFPDFLTDQSGYLSRYGLPSGNREFDGDDSNDTQFFVWISTNGNLDRIHGGVAISALSSESGESIEPLEAELMNFKIKIEDLKEVVYYIYITSNLTGDFPLARSRGIRIRHEPVISHIGDFLSDDSDYLDSGKLFDLDTGELGPVSKSRDSVRISFNAVDFNDTATVKLYYALTDNLELADLVTSGTSPDEVVNTLKGAVPIDTTAILLEGRDSSQFWDIAKSDSVYVPAGDYYIYGVINDGTIQALGRSKHTYRVRHSPFIALDVRQNKLIQTGGAFGERYYTVTWNGDRGHSGDRAIGDSAKISLYYSSRLDYSIPDGVSDIISAAWDPSRDTHLIVEGLEEKADRRIDNQYEWDLWTYGNPDDGGVPREGIDYGIYAIVETDSLRRLVRWDNESGQPQLLQFRHEPFIRVLQPANTFEINGKLGFSVEWEVIDVDDDAGIWVILTSAVAAENLGDLTNYGVLRSDGMSEWLANSEDGCSATAQVLMEKSQQKFIVRPATLLKNMSCEQLSITDGEYYAYIVVDETLGDSPKDHAVARRAPGRIKISGLGPNGANGLPNPNLEFLPSIANTVSLGDTVTVEIYPNTGGEEVDLVTVFASVDTALVRLIDQDSGQSGIQPFKLLKESPGTVLRDTLLMGQDSLYVGKYLLDLVYYEQMGTRRYDGRTPIASVQFVPRDSVGTTSIELNHYATRKTAFYRNGETLAHIASRDAMTINIQSRGIITGKVPLQGRDDFSGITTFYLRNRNSFEPINDAKFIAKNDDNPTLPGIQDSLAADGSFSLVDIPQGEYQLVVSRSGYLDGQIPVVQIDDGKTVSDLRPTFQMDGKSNPGYLLGGDVTGYVNREGKSISDNEIDQLDVDYVVAYFGQTVVGDEGSKFADIDGDSLVWITDLNMVAANFNSQGVAPVYKVVSGSRHKDSFLNIVSSESNDRLIIETEIEGVSGMRAYVVRANYDPQVWRWIRAVDMSFPGRQTVVAEHLSNSEITWASAIIGRSSGINSRSRLANLEFQRIGDGETPVVVGDMEWVDASGYRHRAKLNYSYENNFALYPNIPNPFNPYTEISYNLPYEGSVDVGVYDVLGRRVRGLISGNSKPGLHSVGWNGRDNLGRDVASGTYFLRLRFENRVSIRKMLLLR